MSTPDAVPGQQAVSVEFGCPLVGGCTQHADCWVSGACLWARRKHTPGSRKKDSLAIRRKLLMVRECYSCEQAASDGHHIVFRSQGGDDVVENIAPLCHHCHMVMHFSPGEEALAVRKQIGRALLRNDHDAITYALRKLGRAGGMSYLSRVYFVGSRELERCGLLEGIE